MLFKRNEKVNTVPVAEIKVGETFLHQGDLCMRIKSSDAIAFCNLATGDLDEAEEALQVVPVYGYFQETSFDEYDANKKKDEGWW